VEEKWERTSPYVILTLDKYGLRRFVKAVLLDWYFGGDGEQRWHGR
jgi:hypothetical protein